ncbi:MULTISPECIES: alcohol dehydrogenase catalytic domain-containing protein [unclassified Pseudonocardia]|uniref:alcohol dehydrogenase catalytic domain-containing protein n=1 Tax=unclassified Pseudonocardia TaxID=2619320 RepID=UPI0001FFDAD0|nr:alcohol dehydrogenase catalytic domain-containing protein [Pseudonocardia sp. Ae707_Ps1]OLM20298.1 Alcohol dehydrogenase [Pseudonocardia sp. Ae707_Ps1]
MRAVRRIATGRVETVGIEVPEPGPGQVRLEVLAAGVCHSDLHVVDTAVGDRWPGAFTLGHEVCGRVADTGPGVDPDTVGDQVVVYAPYGCGSCARCLHGRANYCDHRSTLPAAGIGLGVDGGMADALVVDAWRLVPAPGLDPRVAATLTDAGLTSFHAVAGSLDRLDAHDAVAVVIGVGGLGHLAIGLLRQLTPARVVGVDSRAAAVGLARECGAALATTPDSALQAVRDLSGGRGADVVLDCVGSQGTEELAASLLRPAADLVVVGSGGGALAVTKPGPLPAGARVQLPFWGTLPELADVVGLAAGGRLTTRVTEYGLDQAGHVLDELRHGRVTGRAVLVPGKDAPTS